MIKINSRAGGIGMRLIVTAPKGKMGSAITRIAAEKEAFTLTAGLAPKKREYVGRDLGEVALTGRKLGVLVVDELESVIESCDVIIDFSTVDAMPEILNCAVRHKKAYVCGTTGFSEAQKKMFADAAKEIPVLHAANTSRMVFLLRKLTRIAAEALGESVDVEIFDMHDRWKKDAPSGTAKELGETVAEARGQKLQQAAVFGREGVSPREEGTIGFHSMRAGDIASSHTVCFGGFGERLELTHHSYHMDSFARGACDCALYLEGKGAGFYTVEDVFEGRK